MKDVLVDAFWSVIVYDEKGFIPKNNKDVYSYISVTAGVNRDGSITIQFGDYDGGERNRIPLVSGWNYMVRLYRPRREVVDGWWKFPEATPVA